MNQPPMGYPAAPADQSVYVQPQQGYAPPMGAPAPVTGMPPMGAPVVDPSAYAPPAQNYAPPAGMPGAGMPPAGAAPQQGYAPPMGAAPQQGYAPPAGAAPQQGYGERKQRVNKQVGKVTHTGSQLFEINGTVDITDKFPDAIGFVMMVPSRPDQTKASGKTYVMSEKIVIKFSTEELHTLAEALKEAALYGRCTYTKFSDPKKADPSSSADSKKLSVSAIVEGDKVKVFLNSSWGQKKVNMPLDKYGALGLANQIHDLATATNELKFSYDRANAPAEQQ